MSHLYAEPTQDQKKDELVDHRQAETAVPTRPPLTCAAPPGDAQGGLLDWFRQRFQSQNGPEQQTQEASPLQEPAQEPSSDAGQQWIEEDYGEVDPNFVTQKPDADSPLASFVNPYNEEGPGQAPVFETHSFMPRESVDQVGIMKLHSYIGLRFTKLDPISKRYARMRIKAGFGGGGHAKADQGTLIDDSDTQADMSTETPITCKQLEDLMDLIPEKTKEPYNVVTHNCNHFTQAMAKEVGATVPAQLHDSILGPAAAYKNLAVAAENGQQGRTRFFQGGSKKYGQMSLANNAQLIEQFYDTTKTAARRDGVPFMLNSQLRDAAKQAEQSAIPMREYMEMQNLDSPQEESRVAEVTEAVAQKAQDVIDLKLWKSHPRVTITAMKLIAMANAVHSTLLPQRRRLTHYSDEELDASFARTQAEVNAETTYQQTVRTYSRSPAMKNAISTLDPGVKNADLFADPNVSPTSVGDIFLESLHLDPVALLQQHKATSSAEKTSKCTSILQDISGALRNAQSTDSHPFLLRFCQKRGNLTDAQLGAMVAGSIINQLASEACNRGSNLSSLLLGVMSTSRGMAKLRKEDSLDNHQQENTLELENKFTGKKNAAKNEREASSQNQRQALLDQYNLIETLLATKFHALRTLSQSESSSEEPVKGEET